MSRPKQKDVPAPADAPDLSERRATTTYYRYDGSQRGSLFAPDGEPLGRVEPGLVLEVTDPELAARLERHPHFARTTKAKWAEQEVAAGRLTEDGTPAESEPVVSALDPSLDEHGLLKVSERLEAGLQVMADATEKQTAAAEKLRAATTTPTSDKPADGSEGGTQ